MITFDNASGYALLVGLGVTVILGFGNGYLVKCVGNSIEMKSPNDDLVPFWDQLQKMKTAGKEIGLVERLIFFAALWTADGWPVLTSWLVFKLAYYWQGANFASFPDKLPSKEQAAWIVARKQIGTRHVAKVLVGTGANIIVAFIGVAFGKWIQ